jgi:hypothetical protein
MFEAASASLSGPSVVMMGFNSFLRFLFAFPLETFATCLAFWMAACLICEPFMVETDGGAGVGSGLAGRAESMSLSVCVSLQKRGSALPLPLPLLLMLPPLPLVSCSSLLMKL